MPKLIQFVYVSGTDEYKISSPVVITDAPSDTDFGRCAMLHDGSTYRLYCFKGTTNNKIYQFGFNGSSYKYGHNSIPEITLVDAPADADASSFSMLHDGSAYRLYLRQLGKPNQLYQFAFVSGTTNYKWEENSHPKISVTGFPINTDKNRWAMLHDGNYKYYRMKLGNNIKLRQGSFNGSSYEYGHNSISKLRLVDTPEGIDLNQIVMLHDGGNYRFYFMQP